MYILQVYSVFARKCSEIAADFFITGISGVERLMRKHSCLVYGHLKFNKPPENLGKF